VSAFSFLKLFIINMKRVWTFTKSPNEAALPTTNGDAVNFLYDKEEDKMFVVGSGGIVKQTMFGASTGTTGANAQNFLGTNSRRFIPNQATMGTLSTANATLAGTTLWIPILAQKNMILNEVSLNIITSGNSGSEFVVGLFDSNLDGSPKDILFSSSPIATTLGAKQITGLNIQLNVGSLYTIGVKSNASSGMVFRGLPNANTIFALGYLSDSNAEPIQRFTKSEAYTSGFTASPSGLNTASIGGITLPAVFFKIATS